MDYFKKTKKAYYERIEHENEKNPNINSSDEEVSENEPMQEENDNIDEDELYYHDFN